MGFGGIERRGDVQRLEHRSGVERDELVTLLALARLVG